MTYSVTRVNIVVEGHTEEEFVSLQLAPHLAQHGVYVTARRVVTGRTGNQVHRGGITSYAKAARDIRNWLSGSGGAYVTTFFDLYGLPNDFPGYSRSSAQRGGADRATLIEAAMLADIGQQRFIPYVQPHEFEALLFSSIGAIDQELQLISASRLKQLEAELGKTAPEDLNDSPQTAPSKRLLKLFPGYDKPLHGPAIALRIGLDTIRAACPHFDGWLSTLEGLNLQD